jgi:hypothetical protein
MITDLYECGNEKEMLARLGNRMQSGINVIVLLALTDDGRPPYSQSTTESVAAMGVPVSTCTPDQFPDLMATALRKEDIAKWAAGENIKLIREKKRNRFQS